MPKPKHSPPPFYKFFLPIVSREDEARVTSFEFFFNLIFLFSSLCNPFFFHSQNEGEVMLEFVRQFKDELKENWLLIDDGGCTNVVKFNMSVVRPRLTHGWKQLRKDYYLRGTCTIWMHLIEDCVFNMYIFNSEGKELYVPGAPLRDIYKSDDDDDDEFYSNLRQSLSSESSLLDHIEGDGYISAQSSGVVATTDLTNGQQLDVEGGQEVSDVVAADNVVDGADIEPEIIEIDDGLVDGDVIIPVAPIPVPGIVFQCIFTCTLTTYYATKSHLVSCFYRMFFLFVHFFVHVFYSFDMHFFFDLYSVCPKGCCCVSHRSWPTQLDVRRS